MLGNNKHFDDCKNDGADPDAACCIGNARVDRRDGGYAADRSGLPGGCRRSGGTGSHEEKEQITYSTKDKDEMTKPFRKTPKQNVCTGLSRNRKAEQKG